VDEKTCTQCGVTKPLSEFHRNARAADGLRAQCGDCSCAYVKSKYVPRVHAPEQMVCPHCGESFIRVRTQGQPRVYCSRKCTMAAAEHRRLERAASRGTRHCACGAEVMTRVGKPVCPDCRKDPRPDAQVRERARTLRTYGLTEADWDAFLLRQGNRCAVCRTGKPGGRGERWHIDHDHVTGQVRGLLCGKCNSAIGMLQDDPEIIKAAARYVAAHRQMELRVSPR
jgi:Recombination endonuclease VII